MNLHQPPEEKLDTHIFRNFKGEHDLKSPYNEYAMKINFTIPASEVEKGGEHGSIAPRRKWTEPFFAEGFRPSLPHLSPFL